MWLFLAGIGGCKSLVFLQLYLCTRLASLPEGGSPAPHNGKQLFRMVQLLSESFGHANYAVLVAGIGECTQLKELNLGSCVELKSLPNSD